MSSADRTSADILGANYIQRPCCGFVLHVDDADDPAKHLPGCVNATQSKND